MLPRSHAHHTPAATIDSRVQLMAKELDLDANQQATLKSILLTQRAEVAKVWDDPSVPATVRVATTQAVSEKTAERIRAMLNDRRTEHDVVVHNGVGRDLKKRQVKVQWMSKILRRYIYYRY